MPAAAMHHTPWWPSPPCSLTFWLACILWLAQLHTRCCTTARTLDTQTTHTLFHPQLSLQLQQPGPGTWLKSAICLLPAQPTPQHCRHCAVPAMPR
ncbi:hypothetical protein V8C86DRAFT_124635 [Haematococcus lacustris]